MKAIVWGFPLAVLLTALAITLAFGLQNEPMIGAGPGALAGFAGLGSWIAFGPEAGMDDYTLKAVLLTGGDAK